MEKGKEKKERETRRKDPAVCRQDLIVFRVGTWAFLCVEAKAIQ
jgi:hypothetical protein